MWNICLTFSLLGSKLLHYLFIHLMSSNYWGLHREAKNTSSFTRHNTCVTVWHYKCVLKPIIVLPRPVTVFTSRRAINFSYFTFWKVLPLCPLCFFLTCYCQPPNEEICKASKQQRRALLGSIVQWRLAFCHHWRSCSTCSTSESSGSEQTRETWKWAQIAYHSLRVLACVHTYPSPGFV